METGMEDLDPGRTGTGTTIPGVAFDMTGIFNTPLAVLGLVLELVIILSIMTVLVSVLLGGCGGIEC